tara:strand:- start:171 stop:680 length:510 start_codon:yes stop_codon:yes gene_type:complete
MIIGEAPGAKEEELGQPFVGRSGKLLDKLLVSVGIDPEIDSYICNVVKCRPPNNRRPTKNEVLNNLPWLRQQISLVNPLVIILVGSTALESVLSMKDKISKIRGTWQNWEGRFVMPIFHPSYLLRNPSEAEGCPVNLTRLDLFKVREKLQEFGLSSEISSCFQPMGTSK